MDKYVRDLAAKWKVELEQTVSMIGKLEDGSMRVMSGGRDVSLAHADVLRQSAQNLRDGIRVLTNDALPST